MKNDKLEGMNKIQADLMLQKS